MHKERGVKLQAKQSATSSPINNLFPVYEPQDWNMDESLLDWLVVFLFIIAP